MDYESFFHLTEDPFANVPNGKFFFESPQHSQALMRLMHAIERMRGLSLLIGDVGTGKTMLARQMLERLRENGSYEVALIVLTHSEFTPIWLLSRIGGLLGIEEVPQEKAKLLSMVCERLMDIYSEGKKTLLIIDEANHLRNKEVLEDLRGLLNLEISDGRLISFMLAGLPEMEENLSIDKALKQRIALRCHLEPLNSEMVKSYIKYRLKIAGRTEDLFTESAMELIAKYSRGSPRLINAICDNTLLEGFLIEKPIIDAAIVQGVIDNLGLEERSEGVESSEH